MGRLGDEPNLSGQPIEDGWTMNWGRWIEPGKRQLEFAGRPAN